MYEQPSLCMHTYTYTYKYACMYVYSKYICIQCGRNIRIVGLVNEFNVEHGAMCMGYQRGQR